MREIKFRGKRIDNGEWVYGYLVKYGFVGKEKYYIVPSHASALYTFEVDPATVGQYTGKDDMAGTEIYTGCKLRRSDAQICTVRFNKNLLCYEAISEDGGYIPVNQWDKSEVIPC